MPEISDAQYKSFQRLQNKEDKKDEKKAKFNWSASGGNVMGFSGIPGSPNVNISFGKHTTRKKEVKKTTEKTPRQFKELKTVYEGEVMPQGQLPRPEPTIVDAEPVRGKLTMGRKAISAPGPKALPAPTRPSKSGTYNITNAPKSKQFISVDKAGAATPMTNTPYGSAVDFTR